MAGSCGGVALPMLDTGKYLSISRGVSYYRRRLLQSFANRYREGE